MYLMTVGGTLLTASRSPESVRDEWEKARGGMPNTPLPNMREMTEKEFAQSKFFQYNPTFIGYDQIRLPNAGPRDPMAAIHFFVYFDNTAVGLTHDYWKGTVRYWWMGLCEHKYAEISSVEAQKRGIYHGGRCYHVEVCQKCGHVWSYDSSD